MKILHRFPLSLHSLTFIIAFSNSFQIRGKAGGVSPGSFIPEVGAVLVVLRMVMIEPQAMVVQEGDAMLPGNGLQRLVMVIRDGGELGRHDEYETDVILSAASDEAAQIVHFQAVAACDGFLPFRLLRMDGGFRQGHIAAVGRCLSVHHQPDDV